VEVIVEKVRGKTACLDDQNFIERFTADPGVEAHLVDDGIDRSEPEIVEVEAFPSTTPSVRLQRVEGFRTGERLDATLARRIERSQRLRLLGGWWRRSGDIRSNNPIDEAFAVQFRSAGITRNRIRSTQLRRHFETL
jgi:hypothetical protein